MDQLAKDMREDWIEGLDVKHSCRKFHNRKVKRVLDRAHEDIGDPRYRTDNAVINRLRAKLAARQQSKPSDT
jgi:hypothetical protein